MKTIPFILSMSLFVAACNSTAPSPAYPSDRVPYPVNQNPIRPAVSSSSGAIEGKLINSNTGLVASRITIYLAKSLPISPGPAHLLTVDLAVAPRSETNSDGSFIFENIEPGEYGLLLWTPQDTRQVYSSDNSDKELIIVVEANNIVDIGTVKVAVQ